MTSPQMRGIEIITLQSKETIQSQEEIGLLID
jgi:hypothetical protein